MHEITDLAWELWNNYSETMTVKYTDKLYYYTVKSSSIIRPKYKLENNFINWSKYSIFYNCSIYLFIKNKLLFTNYGSFKN